MKRETARRVQREVGLLAREGLDWVSFASRTGDIVRRLVPFDRCCWHPVDPGTGLFTGSLVHNMVCSGAWLAHHEYELDDVNKWHDLARHTRHAASLRAATAGELSRSARVRSTIDYGLTISDELRIAFVDDGVYWGAAAIVRCEGEKPFDDDEVDLLASLSAPIGEGFRRSIVAAAASGATSSSEQRSEDAEPGLLVLDERGELASISPAAERLIAQLVETPVPSRPHDSRPVQAVAARARQLRTAPTSAPPPRARVRTQSGIWLQLYATVLSGERAGHVAVIIQPARPSDIAPVVSHAYGLSDGERRITRMCLEGHSTRVIADALAISEYTVQDHLKSIFRKTGTKSRGQLVGQVFLEHYVPRFESVDDIGGGWIADAIPMKGPGD